VLGADDVAIDVARERRRADEVRGGEGREEALVGAHAAEPAEPVVLEGLDLASGRRRAGGQALGRPFGEGERVGRAIADGGAARLRPTLAEEIAAVGPIEAHGRHERGEGRARARSDLLAGLQRAPLGVAHDDDARRDRARRVLDRRRHDLAEPVVARPPDPSRRRGRCDDATREVALEVRRVAAFLDDVGEAQRPRRRDGDRAARGARGARHELGDGAIAALDEGDALTRSAAPREPGAIGIGARAARRCWHERAGLRAVEREALFEEQARRGRVGEGARDPVLLADERRRAPAGPGEMGDAHVVTTADAHGVGGEAATRVARVAGRGILLATTIGGEAPLRGGDLCVDLPRHRVRVRQQHGAEARGRARVASRVAAGDGLPCEALAAVGIEREHALAHQLFVSAFEGARARERGGAAPRTARSRSGARAP